MRPNSKVTGLSIDTKAIVRDAPTVRFSSPRLQTPRRASPPAALVLIVDAGMLILIAVEIFSVAAVLVCETPCCVSQSPYLAHLSVLRVVGYIWPLMRNKNALRGWHAADFLVNFPNLSVAIFRQFIGLSMWTASMFVLGGWLVCVPLLLEGNSPTSPGPWGLLILTWPRLPVEPDGGGFTLVDRWLEILGEQGVWDPDMEPEPTPLCVRRLLLKVRAYVRELMGQIGRVAQTASQVEPPELPPEPDNNHHEAISAAPTTAPSVTESSEDESVTPSPQMMTIPLQALIFETHPTDEELNVASMDEQLTCTSHEEDNQVKGGEEEGGGRQEGGMQDRAASCQEGDAVDGTDEFEETMSILREVSQEKVDEVAQFAKEVHLRVPPIPEPPTVGVGHGDLLEDSARWELLTSFDSSLRMDESPCSASHPQMPLERRGAGRLKSCLVIPDRDSAFLERHNDASSSEIHLSAAPSPKSSRRLRFAGVTSAFEPPTSPASNGTPEEEMAAFDGQMIGIPTSSTHPEIADVSEDNSPVESHDASPRGSVAFDTSINVPFDISSLNLKLLKVDSASPFRAAEHVEKSESVSLLGTSSTSSSFGLRRRRVPGDPFLTTACHSPPMTPLTTWHPTSVSLDSPSTRDRECPSPAPKTVCPDTPKGVALVTPQNTPILHGPGATRGPMRTIVPHTKPSQAATLRTSPQARTVNRHDGGQMRSPTHRHHDISPTKRQVLTPGRPRDAQRAPGSMPQRPSPGTMARPNSPGNHSPSTTPSQSVTPSGSGRNTPRTLALSQRKSNRRSPIQSPEGTPSKTRKKVVPFADGKDAGTSSPKVRRTREGRRPTDGVPRARKQRLRPQLEVDITSTSEPVAISTPVVLQRHPSPIVSVENSAADEPAPCMIAGDDSGDLLHMSSPGSVPDIQVMCDTSTLEPAHPQDGDKVVDLLNATVESLQKPRDPSLLHLNLIDTIFITPASPKSGDINEAQEGVMTPPDPSHLSPQQSAVRHSSSSRLSPQQSLQHRAFSWDPNNVDFVPRTGRIQVLPASTLAQIRHVIPDASSGPRHRMKRRRNSRNPESYVPSYMMPTANSKLRARRKPVVYGEKKKTEGHGVYVVTKRRTSKVDNGSLDSNDQWTETSTCTSSPEAAHPRRSSSPPASPLSEDSSCCSPRPERLLIYSPSPSPSPSPANAKVSSPSTEVPGHLDLSNAPSSSTTSPPQPSSSSVTSPPQQTKPADPPPAETKVIQDRNVSTRKPLPSDRSHSPRIATHVATIIRSPPQPSRSIGPPFSELSLSKVATPPQSSNDASQRPPTDETIGSPTTDPNSPILMRPVRLDTLPVHPALFAPQPTVSLSIPLLQFPPQLLNVPHLTDLELSSNGLQALPAQLSGLASLQRLAVTDNRITEVPRTIGCLVHLRCLDLRGNQLASLPLQVAHLSALRECYLDHNIFSAVPAGLLQLKRLTRLRLWGNSDIHQLPPLRDLQTFYGLTLGLPRDAQLMQQWANAKGNVGRVSIEWEEGPDTSSQCPRDS